MLSLRRWIQSQIFNLNHLHRGHTPSNRVWQTTHAEDNTGLRYRSGGHEVQHHRQEYTAARHSPSCQNSVQRPHLYRS